MAEIAFEHVVKVFPDGTQAVDDFSLQIEDGECMVLVGPSGCGKSTLLRMVAGLEEITSGRILIGGQVANDLPPKQRGTAMVFQHYALYPHMTVDDNVGFSLRLRRVPKEERRKRVRKGARTLHIDELLERRPRALSGGQRQRVAMGRAIVREPTAFLLDEPLSNLDAKLRVEMRAEISKLRRQLGTTTIYVTHDQAEAMTMGDRVAVINHGMLQQVDEPGVLYLNPVNQFVAGFIGSPPMNFLQAGVGSDGDQLWLEVGGTRVELDRGVQSDHPGLAACRGEEVIVGLRPEGFRRRLTPESERDQQLPGTVTFIERLGSDDHLHLDLGDGNRSIVARVAPEAAPEYGDTVEMPFDPAKLYFFAPETGLTI